ncbi:MATE family efflux transporter [Oribacterium sp. NK2B42]|uniref:MATE family efflux transporter n=1 Tax=Oribacterium sp. NK2B42 TaxID=689781 RepID=UPI000429CF7E|nr:MATE family efflux transporter [Oribacterium sp. NK2B42]
MNKSFERSDAQIISRLFFRLLPAQAFMLALNGLNNMIDGLVGSNFVGAKAMSAIGIYTPLQMACMAVSMILMASSQVLCGRYMGEGRMEKTRGVFSLNLTIALAFTATVTLASFLISRTLAGLLGATQENMADVSNYIIGRGIGVIPLLLGQQLASFLQLERQSMRNYIATGLMLVVNAGFDLLFAAVLGMGAMGLGIATSLSNWAYFAVVGSFFLKPMATLKYSIRAIDWSEIASMVRIGFPSALLIFLTALRSTIFNRMLAAHATLEAVAALATFNMVYILFSAMVSGISTTGRILASVSYGEEDRRSLTLLMRTILTKGYAIVLLTAALEFLLAGFFTGLYYSDHTSAVYAMTLSGIRWGSLFLLLQILASIFSSYYQALGRIKAVNMFSLMEGIAVMGPLAIALVPRMGLDGLWITMLTDRLCGHSAVRGGLCRDLLETPSENAGRMDHPSL